MPRPPDSEPPMSLRSSPRRPPLRLAAALLAASLLAAGSRAQAAGSSHGNSPGAPAAPGAPVPPLATPIPADDLGVPTPLTDPSGRALEHFYQSLGQTKAGKKKTRVMVFGASHVAGDGFTSVLRHRLQALYGDSGPGFVVPAHPWHNYTHRDVDLGCTEGWTSYWVSASHNDDEGLYGLAGCAFEAAERKASCHVATAAKTLFGRSVDEVEVYLWRQPKGGHLLVRLDGERKWRRVATRGPEGRPGYARFQVEAGPHDIELRPKGDGPVRLFGVSLERDQPGVVVDSLGINGARASAQLEWDPRIFAEHITRRAPDLVILAYGTNAIGDDGDPIERYEARLDLVVSRVRSLVPQASCVYVGPSDRPVKIKPTPPTGRRARRQWEARRKAERKRLGYDPDLRFLPRPRQDRVIAAQRRVAHAHGCAYWDWAAMMGGDLSMLRWARSEPRLGARDYVHFTSAGYGRVAALFWDALMERLPRTARVDAPPPLFQ